MLSLPVSQWLARRGIHFAWVIVAITFLTALTSSAALGLPGALLQPLSREFGWDVEQISSALAVRFVLFGLMGPFAAILMERFGLRNIICVALGLIAAGMLLATRMTQFWHLVALWGILLGLGSGMTALVLSAVVANRWFDTHRGLVVGVLTASSATGQLLFLPVGAWLIEHVGWRMAVIPVFASCAVVAVLAFFCMRNRPQDVGLRAYGAGILSSSGELVHAVTSPEPQRIALDLLRTMRTRYKIDSYQQTYFVIDSFQQLFDMTAPDFTPLYAQLKSLPELAADALLPGDVLIR